MIFDRKAPADPRPGDAADPAPGSEADDWSAATIRHANAHDDLLRALGEMLDHLTSKEDIE